MPGPSSTALVGEPTPTSPWDGAAAIADGVARDVRDGGPLTNVCP